jgi:hypothetical protein
LFVSMAAGGGRQPRSGCAAVVSLSGRVNHWPWRTRSAATSPEPFPRTQGGLLVGLLAAGSIIGLDIEPADQAILVLALVWVAALAICLDWLLPSASRRTGEALD